jgi:hypothetical protein
MKRKEVFDYKEPFQAPYMVREITKNLKVPTAIAGQDVFTFLIAFGILAGILFPTVGVNQFTVIVAILVPYGLVSLFNIIQPDGKKVPVFIMDYLKFLFSYQIPKYELYQGMKVKPIKELVVYEPLKIKEMKVKAKDEVSKHGRKNKRKYSRDNHE